MPGVSDKQLRSRSAWPAGIDNVSQETNLQADAKTGVPVALRVADNVDLPAGSGKPQRRAGYTLSVSGSSVHSLWRTRHWPFALHVDAGTLRGLREDLSAFDILAGVDARARVSYELAGERVYWTNGKQTGLVHVDGTPGPWGCETPGGQPALSVAPAGALAPGKYQVAITYVLASGEESGTGQAANVDLPDGGGIALTQIPQPTSSAVSAVRVYVSPANGDVLYQAMDVAVGITTAVGGSTKPGKPLQTQFLTTMPAGRYVALHAGRLFVLQASGELVWSEPLRYGLRHPVNNRMRIAGGGDLLAAVGQGTPGAGIFVAGGKRTYFMGGEPGQMTPTIAYPYGAVPGTLVYVPGSVFGIESAEEVAYWMANNGVGVIGLPGGTISPLREGQTVAPVAREGASLFRQDNGLQQVVTSMSGTSPRGLAMRDKAVVTVVRHDQA